MTRGNWTLLANRNLIDGVRVWDVGCINQLTERLSLGGVRLPQPQRIKIYCYRRYPYGFLRVPPQET